MNIGDVTKATGFRASCIRYYESKGLIPCPARKPNGYRDYPPQVIEVLLLIKAARHRGFPLADLKRVLPSGGRGWPSTAVVLKGLQKMRRDVERQMRDMDTTREQLAWMIQSIEQRPRSMAKGELAKVVVGRMRANGMLKI